MASRWLDERVLALVDAAGGSLETSERKLADRLACSPAGVRKAITTLVRAGKLRTQARANGTLLTLVDFCKSNGRPTSEPSTSMPKRCITGGAKSQWR